ncbi:flagellar basal body-associated FliL family protein [Pseudomonas sp. HR96]|uniref:flagellar basal body-associated FliL family protein n=1 Tax=Pseudomonas sp. HR96 TaxID=1027966 RepID=UPI002A75BF62|nr:flagellar basal body-associated FliL family protein [Pseudomonas sp. HR96]WPP00060.1 flagellar basal body-associated FliL family protein [Pseudomonas sp. HR96]
MTLQRIILALLGVNLVLTVGSGLFNYQQISAVRDATQAPLTTAGGGAAGDYAFHTVDKIIFNLQDRGREHYFVLDLALQTPPAQNPARLKQLEPMVRSTVVAHLAQMDFAQLRALPIAQLQERLQAALAEDFAGKQLDLPFSAVLVSKLIVQ